MDFPEPIELTGETLILVYLTIFIFFGFAISFIVFFVVHTKRYFAQKNEYRKKLLASNLEAQEQEREDRKSTRLNSSHT